MKHAMTLGFVFLTAAAVVGCKKRPDPAQGAPPGQSKMTIEEIFQIGEADQFSNELGFHLVTRGFERLNPTEKVVAAIWELEGEVHNGGFDQYFHNSAGDHSAEALAGLETIGAPKMADLLRKAMSVFPSGRPSPDRDARSKQMEGLPSSAKDRWSDLDGQFTQFPDNTAELVKKYGHANRHAFKQP